MPRPSPKLSVKRKPAPKAKAKAVVAARRKAAPVKKKAKPALAKKKKTIVKPAVKPAVKQAIKQAIKKEGKAAAKPAAPAPKLKLAVAVAAKPSAGVLKFPATKAAPARKEAPASASAATPPPVAEPVRSTAHLPRPGEAKDAWLARVAHDYYRFLYATALSITRSNDDAEDAVQNAVMNGLKRLDQLTEPGAIVSWLAMITRNAALDLLRRKKRAPGGGGDATVLPLAAPDKETGYEMASDTRQILANAITTLPLSYQEVVNARHFDGMEVEDIAKKFAVTENNVRVRLFRAYEKLRESVQVRKALGLPTE